MSSKAIWQEFVDALSDRNYGVAARIALVNPDVIPRDTAKCLLNGHRAYHRRAIAQDLEALREICGG